MATELDAIADLTCNTFLGSVFLLRALKNREAETV